MRLLELREAALRARGRTVVPPTTLSVGEATRRAYPCADAAQACVLAMMACGLVRPTSGAVFIGAFDPRIQPVQVKRIVGYVPYDAHTPQFSSFTRYVEYRAALWGLPTDQTVVRAQAMLARLDGVHEAFAYPLVGALLAKPRLLVLDRPQAVYAAHIFALAGECAVFSTHASVRDADRFAEQTLLCT